MDILTELEKCGGETFSNAQLKELVRQCPKAAEFNRAILSLLLNYTEGIAKGMVEYGVDNGFDAWRRLYHHYLPLADDLQQILIQELCGLQPVTEGNIEASFNQVERITELYTGAGKADDAISEKWIKAAVLRDLPKQVTRDLALQLKDATIVNDVRNTVNIYLHDHQTGMPRGQAGPMLRMAAEVQDGQADQTTASSLDSTKTAKCTGKEPNADNDANRDKDYNGDNDLYAAYKGPGKGKKGAKGYGECWHCGEWGHPRRECPHLNDPTNGKGALAALKGGKQGGGKGRGRFGKGRGKGKGGKGRWSKGYNYNYKYMSPGKGMGKGINQLDDDWYNAWWSDYTHDHNYYKDEYIHWNNREGSLGNVTMMFERGKTSDEDEDENTWKRVAGERDP